MKQTDNRQKQQIQLRAEKTHYQKNLMAEKGSSHSTAPEPESKGSAASADSGTDAKPQIYHAPPQVGRNELCPCGSGKKFKKCCIDKPQV